MKKCDPWKKELVHSEMLQHCNYKDDRPRAATISRLINQSIIRRLITSFEDNWLTVWSHQQQTKSVDVFVCLSVEADDVGETSENKAASSVQPQPAPLSDLPAVSSNIEGEPGLCFLFITQLKLAFMRNCVEQVEAKGEVTHNVVCPIRPLQKLLYKHIHSWTACTSDLRTFPPKNVHKSSFCLTLIEKYWIQANS